MAHTPNEYITTDEQSVFIDKCTFYMFIKSKPVKYRINVWVAADARKFYAYNMQVYNGKTDEAREKTGPLSCQRYGLSHIWKWKRCYCNNFHTRCELANLLLTWNMTLVGTLR